MEISEKDARQETDSNVNHPFVLTIAAVFSEIRWHLQALLLSLVVSMLLVPAAHAVTISPSTASFTSENGVASQIRRFSLQIDSDESIDSVFFCELSCSSDGDGHVYNALTGQGRATVSANGSDAEWLLNLQCVEGQDCGLDVQFVGEAAGEYRAEILVNTNVFTATTVASDVSSNNRQASALLTGTALAPVEPRGVIEFSPTAYSVDEDEGTIVVTARRVDGTNGRIEVDYATGSPQSDSAIGGTDYARTSGTLTWEDDVGGSMRVAIPIFEDTVSEQDETFSVVLSNADEQSSVGQFPVATVTIQDVTTADPGTVEFTSATYSVRENAGEAEVTVVRSGGSAGEARVVVSTLGGSTADQGIATEGVDFTGVSELVIWDEGEMGSQTVMIPIESDSLIEGNETFQVQVVLDEIELFSRRSSTAALNNAPTIGAIDEATVTIIDVPPAMSGTIEFSASTYTVSESASTVAVTVERVGGSDGAIDVRYSTRDGSAVGAGDGSGDYGSGTGTLSWADGDVEPQIIEIQINSDTDGNEGNEVFFVDLSNQESARVIITDVAPLNRGIVEFAPTSYTAMESDGAVTISAVRRQGSAGETTVIVSTVNGTALAGSDYIAAQEELTWTEDDTSTKSVTIALVEDNTSEPPERFTVRLTLANEQDAGEGLLGSATTATVNIIEPDDPGTLQFSASSYPASETDGEVELVVTRSGGSNGALTAIVSTNDGTADAGDDYESTQRQLQWADGDLDSQTVSVPILRDTLVEPSETFTATLSVPAGQASDTLGTPSRAIVTITDVAAPRITGTVQFTSATASVAENEGQIRLQVSRTGGRDDAIAMSVQARSGTATLGEDFQFEPVTVRWVNQDVGMRTVVIPVVLDNLDEVAETFQVSLVATGADVEALGTPDTVTVTISDISNPFQAGTLSLSRQSYTVSEAQGSVTLAVNRTGGSEGAVSVQYDTVAGSAQSPEDFTSASGRLNWGDGDASPKELTLTIAADVVVEDDEQFDVTLSDPLGPDNASLSLDRTSSTVTIQDSTNIGQLQFSEDIYSGSEANGLVAFSVERVGGSDGAVSVDYRLQSGTATAGEDYIGVSGTLDWADGDENPKNAAVRLLTDAFVEPLETFEIVLSNARPLGDEQIAQGVAAVQIVDSTTFTVMGPLAPFVLTIVSGDNQSLLPGEPLDPLVLQASIEAPATDSVDELTINWRVEPAGSAELVDGIQTTTDANGMASNQVRVLDRGFVRVLARVGQRLQPEPISPGIITGRIAPPPVDMVEGEIAFTLRSGLFAAEGLNNNQAQTGGALDTACVALDQQSDPQSNDPVPLTAAQRDLQATCRALEIRLEDGTLASAMDRLAPEELFTLGDSVIDTTDLQITNVYSRINAIRSGRSDSVDVAGLSLDIRGELIPGSVVEAAQNTLPSGGAASTDGGYSSRFGVFANGALSVGEVDGDDNQRDADVSTSGLTIGMDYRLSANSAVGIGLGIANNQTEFTGDEGRVDLSAVNLSLFATYYEENSGYVDVVLDAGLNQFDIERRIDLPDTERRMARGSTDATVLALTIGAGFDKNYGTLEFGPYGRLSVASADIDAYRETADSDGVGSGSVLAIESHSVRSTTISIGAQASRPISTRTGVFVPQLRIEGEVELTDRKDGITATFQHDPSQSAFEVNGNERDTSYLNIGLGSSFLLANGRSGYVFYETRAQHEFVTQHWLKLGLRLEFR